MARPVTKTAKPEKVKPVHPGEIAPVTRIAERRWITAGTALRLARYFKTAG